MKIGILTFHRAHNYGAVLQCFALSSYLKSQGHEVFVVDYKNEFLLEGYNWYDPKSIVRKNLFKSVSAILILPQKRKRYIQFERFIDDYLNLITPEEKELEDFDCFIIGSDQVWNIKLTNGFDKWYWGDIRFFHPTKIISYAASMEEYWGEENDNCAKNLLSKFNAISVREDSLKIRLQKLLNKPIAVTADPTLLLGCGVWGKIALKPPIKQPYLFLYQVRNQRETYEYAKKIAKNHGLKFVCLSARADAVNTDAVMASSPCEFVGLIKYAAIVVACSFHGVIFSVIFRKQFVAIKLGDGRDSRYSDFLNSIGLENTLRDVTSNDYSLNTIDYNKAEDYLKNITNHSKIWLKENLK